MKQSVSILVAVILLIAIIFSGCMGEQAQLKSHKTELTVFAAASLSGVMTEISRDYESSHPGVQIVSNFDGSQALRTQIEQGAYADVFLSANTKQLNALRDQGLLKNDTIGLFAKNKLIVITPISNPAHITTLKDLSRPNIRLVIGVKDVPVGDYARQILKKMANDTAYGTAYEEAVLNNVMSEETAVTSVVAKVQLDEADAGIVYQTDITPNNRDKFFMIPIPDEYNVIAEYPAGVLQISDNTDEALRFITYLKSGQGRSILIKYGFAEP
jgi:molybdate transport system substrate-binding protein